MYLDEYHYSALFDSIGKNNIFKIKAIYKYPHQKNRNIDEDIYNGVGKIPDIYDIFKLFDCRDGTQKLIINDSIEVDFPWWDDIIIIADYDTIIRCILGQKELVSIAQKEILEQLTDSQSTYFKLKNDLLIQSQAMNLEDFMIMIIDSYDQKFEELMLDENFTDED